MWQDPFKVKYDVEVTSTMSPEQTACSKISCEMDLISYNGKIFFENANTLISMAKSNLDSDGPLGVKFQRPKIYVEVIMVAFTYVQNKLVVIQIFIN